ncbi:MAG: GTPase [Flavobacteriales bacterium]|nr:GTPase [Flavobacteriales bacterium]
MNGALDSAHKILSPSTYSCDLCALTHGTFGAKKEWKKFTDRNGSDAVFYHKNDLPEAYRHHELPTILGGSPATVLVSAEEFKSITSLSQLIEIIEKHLA